MGLSKGGSGSISTYQPVTKKFSKSENPVGWGNALTVTGEGVIDKITFTGFDSTARTVARIIVDGKTVFQAAVANTKVSGILNTADVRVDNSYYYSDDYSVGNVASKPMADIKDFPYIASTNYDADMGIIVLSRPIPFKNSVQIDFMSNGSGGSVGIAGMFMGGLK